mgnify:CR=1 FL=1
MVLSAFKSFLPVFLIQKKIINKKYWVRSPIWDLFWLHSSVWLGLLIFAFRNQPELEMFYMAGVFLFWISHRLSSFYLAWGTQSYRSVCASQPWRFVFFPAIIVLSVFVMLFIPENVLPVAFPLRILGLLLLDFFWGMHHFAAQHYGILRLFEHMKNPYGVNSSRLHDRLFCWVMGFFLVLIAELLHGVSFLQQKQILPAIPHNWDNEIIPIFLRIGTLLVIIITTIMIRNAFLLNSGLPRILYILGLGIMVVGAFELHPVEFLMLWTLQHWITALGMTAQMGGNDIKKNMFIKKRIFKIFFSSSSQNQWIILLFLCSISVILTPFFEIEAVSSGERYSELILPSLIFWLENSSWVNILVGVGIASGFVHYFLDRAVYRFSDSKTRMTAKNLLFD